jgi:protein-S-isoprenylcysteine O-methyltransferase Ste14
VPISSLLRYRVPLGFLLAACYVWLAQPISLSYLLLCSLMVSFGCTLRSWAAGYLLKGKRVAVGGPYAYVRNPLYLGSFILGLGFSLALYREPLPVLTLIFWAIFLLGFLVVYRAKSLAEEQELLQALGGDYANYRQRVPAFLPIHGRVAGLGEQRFSRELYHRNREYQCVLGSLCMLAFLFWRLYHGV